MFTANELKKDLQDSGVKPSDTLLIHSSMKSIGEVDGGAETVLKMLMEYFSEEGLLLFPTLSYRFLSNETPLYDVKNTPSCTGILPELFRQMPGVIRSLHPTHSLAAYGKDAAAFVAGHETFDSPAVVGSPWWRLLQRKGKILFIGTGISCNTFLHGSDEWLDLPGMLTETRQDLKVIDYSGKLISSPQRRHCSGGRNGYYGSLEDKFDEAGALKRCKLGNANCHLLDCEKICKVLGYSI